MHQSKTKGDGLPRLAALLATTAIAVYLLGWAPVPAKERWMTDAAAAVLALWTLIFMPRPRR